jgi:ubiquitin C-terminal hydrolase
MSKYTNNINNNINNNYKLYAVNNHHNHGNSINTGHYTSTVINRFDNKWYIFNDTNDLEETNDIINKNAYNLFYIRND